jgi:hypothetical protein
MGIVAGLLLTAVWREGEAASAGPQNEKALAQDK